MIGRTDTDLTALIVESRIKDPKVAKALKELIKAIAESKTLPAPVEEDKGPFE
jgi:hypothetical protein